MVYSVSSLVSTVKTCFPCLNKDSDETVHFVKYDRFRDEREMTEMPSNKLNSSENGSIPKIVEPNGEITSSSLTEGNQITEWQAGWNVTNAIQVLFDFSLTVNATPHEFVNRTGHHLT